MFYLIEIFVLKINIIFVYKINDKNIKIEKK